MEDWAKKLDAFLEFNDRNILQDSEKLQLKLLKNLQKVSLKNIE